MRCSWFGNKTICEATRSTSELGIETTGPLLENLDIDPMSARRGVTVDAKGPIQIPLRLSQKVDFYLEFQMLGPIRRIRRIIELNL